MRRIKNSWIVGAVVAIIIIAAIMTFVGRKQSERLPTYDGTDALTESQTTSQSSTEETEEIETIDYEDASTGLSCKIPSEWERVDEGKIVRFIHRASGTAVQIETSNYYPSINNESSETLSEKITGDGYTFMSFNRYSTHAYEAVYQDKKNSTFDYIQDTIWDRDTIAKITFIVNDSYYEKMENTMNTVLSSATFNSERQIPDDAYLYYSETGSFEFGVPNGWTLGIADNSYVATDPNTGAFLTVMLAKNDNSAGDMDMLDMSDIMKQNKLGYMLKSFDADDNMAIGTATYTSDGTQMMLVQYIFSQGGYWYYISFTYQEGIYDTSAIQECAGLFRSFLSEEITQEE